MGKVFCCILSDTILFMCKIYVPTGSMACLCLIHSVSGHHSSLLFTVCFMRNSSSDIIRMIIIEEVPRVQDVGLAFPLAF